MFLFCASPWRFVCLLLRIVASLLEQSHKPRMILGTPSCLFPLCGQISRGRHLSPTSLPWPQVISWCGWSGHSWTHRRCQSLLLLESPHSVDGPLCMEIHLSVSCQSWKHRLCPQHSSYELRTISMTQQHHVHQSQPLSNVPARYIYSSLIYCCSLYTSPPTRCRNEAQLKFMIS